MGALGFAIAPGRGRVGAQPLASAVFDFTGGSLPAGATLTRASTATRIDATGTLVSVASHVARFDHDPATLALRGLLIEPAATNKLLASAAMGAAPWYPAAAMEVTGSGVAPDGTTTATRLTMTGGGIARHYQQYTPSGQDTLSLWLRGAAGGEAIGTVVTAPGPGPATLFDLASTVEIELAHGEMMLAEGDDAGLDAGANLALVGDELLQFGTAVPLGDNRWRLGRLLRGQRGTEAAAGAQVPGDRLVLIEPEVMVPIDLPASAIGATARVQASSVGDLDGPATAAVLVDGASIRPPAPVHVALSMDGAMVRWTRRSRSGWRWTDGVDAPLGEERETYRVAILPEAGAAREIETDGPEVSVPMAEQPVTLTIRQVGTFGPSPAATLTIPA